MVGAKPSTNGHARGTDPQLFVEPLAGLRPKPLKWLVPGRIPAGLVGLLAGDGGHGKSMTTLELSAAVTTGRCAFGLTYPNPVKGRALLVSCEDDWERTIIPRLATLGADLSRVLRVRGVGLKGDGQTLDFHLGHYRELEQLLKADPEIRLVCIDPAGAYIGRSGVNEHKDAELRTILDPLNRTANNTGATVLLVKHLNKSANVSAVQRVGGSVGYVNAVRFAYMIAPDPDDPDRKLMLPIKANVLPAGTHGLAYRMEAVGRDEARSILSALWPDLDPGDMDELAGQLFRQRWEDGVTNDPNAVAGSVGKRSDQNRVAKCAEWLREFLGEYAHPSSEIEGAAKRAGFTFDNLKEAKVLLKDRGLSNSNLGRLRGVWWSGFGSPEGWVLRPDPASAPHTPTSPMTPDTPLSPHIGKVRGNQCGETGERRETRESGETGDGEEGIAPNRLFANPPLRNSLPPDAA